MKKLLTNFVVLMSLAISGCVAAATTPVSIFSTDFNNGVSSEITGYAETESVQGFSGLGNAGNVFSGNFLRNLTGGRWGPLMHTNITLGNLPSHNSFDLHFLLALIDAWGGEAYKTYFNLSIDGNLYFRETFGNEEFKGQSYVPPVNGIVSPMGVNRGWTRESDVGYDLGLDPYFNAIPHSADSLSISMWADGPWWRGGIDQSWAIDNIEIVINRDSVPEPSPILLLGIALVWLVVFNISSAGGAAALLRIANIR